MNIARPIPTSLKVVAALFILGGVASLIEIAVALWHGRVSVNFGVMGIFIGTGLLRLHPTWRMWALVFIWIALIVAPIVGILVLAGDSRLDLQLLGLTVGRASTTAGFIAALALFLIALWQYRVLTRRDIRMLFGR
jgi:hypothetical protein